MLRNHFEAGPGGGGASGFAPAPRRLSVRPLRPGILPPQWAAVRTLERGCRFQRNSLSGRINSWEFLADLPGLFRTLGFGAGPRELQREGRDKGCPPGGRPRPPAAGNTDAY